MPLCVAFWFRPFHSREGLQLPLVLLTVLTNLQALLQNKQWLTMDTTKWPLDQQFWGWFRDSTMRLCVLLPMWLPRGTCFTINSFTGWWFGTCFIFPYIGNNHPNWLSYFSEGFKPPTSSLSYLNQSLAPGGQRMVPWFLPSRWI